MQKLRLHHSDNEKNCFVFEFVVLFFYIKKPSKYLLNNDFFLIMKKWDLNNAPETRCRYLARKIHSISLSKSMKRQTTAALWVSNADSAHVSLVFTHISLDFNLSDHKYVTKRSTRRKVQSLWAFFAYHCGIMQASPAIYPRCCCSGWICTRKMSSLIEPSIMNFRLSLRGDISLVAFDNRGKNYLMTFHSIVQVSFMYFPCNSKAGANMDPKRGDIEAREHKWVI